MLRDHFQISPQGIMHALDRFIIMTGIGNGKYCLFIPFNPMNSSGAINDDHIRMLMLVSCYVVTINSMSPDGVETRAKQKLTRAPGVQTSTVRII